MIRPLRAVRPLLSLVVLWAAVITATLLVIAGLGEGVLR
jgi:hypothetical protein